MNFIKNIEIKNFTYNLPDEKIAKFPLKNRDDSKLLVYKDGKISENQSKNIADFLPPSGLIVFNNTKVIQARLHFRKSTGALIEIFCLEPYEPTEYELNLASLQKCKWKCLVGNLKKWKNDDLENVFDFNNEKITFKARKIESNKEFHIIEFEWNNYISFAEILDKNGEIPIPPYLNRESNEEDLKTYQTIYSKIKGSVAAPTAGLHFTEETLKKISAKGIEKEEITLHVGAGTFKPVKENLIENHEMHTEQFFIRIETVEKILKNIGNITAVGTTTVRTLESIYWIGIKLINNKIENSHFNISQWEVYDLPQNTQVEKAFIEVYNYLKMNKISILHASTQIMIVPGYKFQIIDKLITNFHQPQSTLLLLVSAFIGDNWRNVYDYALENNFRFLSYGDSSILFRS